MKKIILKILMVFIFLLIILIGGFLIWLKSILPSKEERISFGKNEMIEKINEQLKDVNLEEVKRKTKLMENKGILDIQTSIKNKEFTYEELVAYYLINIKELDQSENGNNAVSEINPNAIKEARKYDNANENLPLKGIPVLVKENINTNDMPTSSGTYALKDFIPQNNASVIKKLKENGAIILGKTNLSELSNWMSQKNPSGYSAKKGQTHNPFKPIELSPFGSSAGSAVAMATDLATVTLGTETVGSIIAPAAINSTVGYKPTRDKINGEGVIPISLSLDTVGIISKTVEDAVITYNSSSEEKISYNLDENYIKNKRIGILKGDEIFNKNLKEKLLNMGVEVIELNEIDTSEIDVKFILLNDFERDFNMYLEKNKAPIKSLKELVEYNKKDQKIRMRYGQTHLEKSLSFSKHNDEKVKNIIKLAQNKLNEVMMDNNLDAIVFQDNKGVLLTAVAGGPQVTVPFGKDGEQPIGATFAGKLNEDEKILQISYSFEKKTNMREYPNK